MLKNKKRMRILHIITLADAGGAQSVVQHLANFCASAHDVAVVSTSEGPMWRMLDPKVKKYPLPNLIREISIKRDISVLWMLRRIYSDFRPDVIHLHSSKIGALGRICLPAKKIIYTVHGFDSIRVAFRKFLLLERVLQFRSAATVAVSNYDEKNLRDEGIMQNIEVIYNGVSVSQDDIPQFDLDHSKKNIICIARLDPPKRYDLFNSIASRLPEYNFIWIGNKETPDIPVASNTYWLGEVAQASRYFKNSDLCLLVSDYEGLPMSIIEAMAYGKPVVASNVGGISEIVQNGVNGFALANEPAEMSEKIDFILKNEELCQSFGAASKQIFESKLQVSKMAASYLALYTKILKS